VYEYTPEKVSPTHYLSASPSEYTSQMSLLPLLALASGTVLTRWNETIRALQKTTTHRIIRGTEEGRLENGIMLGYSARPWVLVRDIL
jgi:hypothetical protein